MRDLALVELEYVPLSAVELPIAAVSPTEGEPVHNIGNPGASGAFFVSNSGSVRQVVRKSARTNTGQLIDAFKVEVQNPINGGDSGGPLFNNRGELVGVNSTGRETSPDGQGGLRLVHLVSDCIDVREVHAVLQRFRQYR